MYPYTNAVVYAVVAIVVLPVMFGLFKTPYTLFDIVLGALAGAACFRGPPRHDSGDAVAANEIALYFYLPATR